MKPFARRFVAFVCVAAAVAVTVSAWRSAGVVRSEDRNHDGRPDVWRFYDARGELTRVATDSNFDGRSDQQDYYVHGALIRRELDRNLDDRTDLIESFDPTSHQKIREVIDNDFNGTADLLVLFNNGRPVFSEWLPQEARPADIAAREPSAPLAPLVDPSRYEAALQAVAPDVSAGGTVAVLSTMGLPEHSLNLFTVITGSRATGEPDRERDSLGPPSISLVVEAPSKTRTITNRHLPRRPS